MTIVYNNNRLDNDKREHVWLKLQCTINDIFLFCRKKHLFLLDIFVHLCILSTYQKKDYG